MRMSTVACLLLIMVALLLRVKAQDLAASFNFPNGDRVAESAGNFQACVVLNRNVDTNVNINVATFTLLNTQPGVNFGSPEPSTLMFQPGSATQLCFNVSILSDNIVQTMDQSFFGIQLISTLNTITLPSPVAVFIEESDVLQVAFSSPSYTAQEPPQPSTSICLNVINGMLAPDSEVRVRFSLQQETATAGLDYIPPLAELIFNSTSVQECSLLTVQGDENPEDAETLSVLAMPTTPNSMIVNGINATIFIEDNDAATIGFQQTAYTVDEGNFGSEIQQMVCVLLSLPFRVNLERLVLGMVTTEGINAAGEQDFEPLNRTFNFSSANGNGDTYCFQVTIIGDNINEQNETFRLRLTSLSGDVVSPEEAIITIRHDGDVNLCPTLLNITNGSVSVTGFDEGAVANYTCNGDHILRGGAATRNCQANGTWSGNEPECRIPCPTLDLISNGDVSLRDGTEGDVAAYSCVEGFTLTGEEMRICQSDSQWSGEEPSCDMIAVITLDQPVPSVIPPGQLQMIGIGVGVGIGLAIIIIVVIVTIVILVIYLHKQKTDKYEFNNNSYGSEYKLSNLPVIEPGVEIVYKEPSRDAPLEPTPQEPVESGTNEKLIESSAPDMVPLQERVIDTGAPEAPPQDVGGDYRVSLSTTPDGERVITV